MMSVPAATDQRWLERPLAFRYRIGELTIARASFRGRVLDEHFTNLVGGPPAPSMSLEHLPRNVDVIKLPSYPVESPAPRLKWVPGGLQYVPTQYRRWYVALDGNFDNYLAGFSGKSRSTIRRKVRRFADLSGGTIDWREYSSPDAVGEFLTLARHVSSKTFQERLLGSGLPSGTAFDDQVRQLAGAGNYRGYLLFHDGKPISYLSCPAQDGNLLYQHVGYDPAYAEWSPGGVLLFLVLERLFGEKAFRTFDFTEGEGAHKEFFANANQLCADFYFFRRRAINIALVFLHSSVSSISYGLARAAERFGIKRAIKRALRRVS